MKALTNKLFLYGHTLRHLQPTQIGHLILKRILTTRRHIPKEDRFSPNPQARIIPRINESRAKVDKEENLYLKFINKESIYNIFPKEEPLWIFNQFYFEYINDQNVPISVSKKTLIGFYSESSHPLAYHPYPSSLRVIAVIRFITASQWYPDRVITGLWRDLAGIANNIEKDLEGNHLLSNLIALCLGYSFFSGPVSNSRQHQYDQLLNKTIKKQIGEDGIHCERSFLYQITILEQLSHLILLSPHRYSRLRPTALLMFDTLYQYLVEDQIPQFNDTTSDIKLRLDELRSLGELLGVESKPQQYLHISNATNFAIVRKSNYTLTIDGGGLYEPQPGHIHAGALSFELFCNNEKIITDSGCSTYLAGEARSYQRSTSAHNTVEIADRDQFEVWGSFRVARRGKFYPLREIANGIKGAITHQNGAVHHREITFETDQILIKDTIMARKELPLKFRLHFYPGVSLSQDDNGFTISNKGSVKFTGDLDNIRLETTPFYPAFNKESKKTTIVGSTKTKKQTNILTTIKLN